MTTFAVSVAFNMNQAEVVLPAGDWLYHNLTPTLAHYYDDVLNYADFGGFGLGYDGVGNFDSGTVTSYAETENGALRLSLSNMSIDAGILYDLLQANDASGLFDIVLAGNDVIIGSAGADALVARGGNDRLYGGAGNDILMGEVGRDSLYGGRGRDSLFGGPGNDVLDSGLGNDRLSGGVGLDSFVFSTALGAANIDSIVNYSVADDTIVLSATIFAGAGTQGTTLTAERFFIGAAAHDLDDRIIYNDSTGALLFDADGNTLDGVAAVQFATISPGLALTELDFRII